MSSAENCPPYNTPTPKSENKSDIVEGIYAIVNKETRLLVDLHQGKADDRTPCHGYHRTPGGTFAFQFWSVRQDGDNQSCTLRNLRSATYLDLISGRKADGSTVCGHSRASAGAGRANAEWILKAQGGEFYILQCRSSGTCLQVIDNTSTGGAIVCSAFVEGKARQLWDLERVSRTGEEIIDIIGNWKESMLPQLCKSYRTGANFIMVPSHFRREIWEKTGLRDIPLKPYVFDYDAYVVKMKEAVTTRARDNYNLEGVSLLFGIIYGQTKRGPEAFNWYLSADLHALMFFDAQRGEEYTCAGLEARGFQPSFMVF